MHCEVFQSKKLGLGLGALRSPDPLSVDNSRKPFVRPFKKGVFLTYVMRRRKLKKLFVDL